MWEPFLKRFQGSEAAALLCNFLGRVGKSQGLAPRKKRKKLGPRDASNCYF